MSDRDTTLSEALMEAYAVAPVDRILYHTIELNHALFVSPIYVVRAYEGITAPLENGTVVDFVSYAFDFDLPGVAERGDPEVVVTIDNVSRDILAAVEQAATSQDLITLTYRVYVGDNLAAGPQNVPPLTLTIKHISATPLRITARAGFQKIADLPFPRNLYTVEEFPGLLR